MYAEPYGQQSAVDIVLGPEGQGADVFPDEFRMRPEAAFGADGEGDASVPVIGFIAAVILVDRARAQVAYREMNARSGPVPVTADHVGIHEERRTEVQIADGFGDIPGQGQSEMPVRSLPEALL